MLSIVLHQGYIIQKTIPLMCNTPVLTPFAFKVYDVNIVFNRGVELKSKAPPSIKHVVVRQIN